MRRFFGISSFSLLIGTLTLSIFLIDAFTPLSIAIAVLYGAVILLATSKYSPRAIVALSFLCLFLTLTAYGLGHRFDFIGPAFGRCVISLSAIIIITLLALRGQAAMRVVRESGEALRQADRRKDEFLAMLAHELRNPIAPISGAAYLLKISPPEADLIEETTDIIIRQADHLSSLVDDLLDVSRITRRLVTLEKCEVDLKQVTTDAVEQMRPLIDAAKHELTIRLPQHPVFVLGDHKRLVQVISNLLSNAIKYTPDGGKITLNVEVIGENVELEIADTGIGISAELLPHVFELFTQAQRTPDREQGGLGIGLALVQNLVDLHGGTVTARSLGAYAGSTFVVTLPFLMTETSPTSRAVDMPMVPTTNPLRILVVDDNVDIARMLTKFLLAAGHHAVALHGSKEALALAEHKSFDAYFLDIGLPEIDGNSLVRCLRKLPGANQALMVAITGYGQKFDRENALECGFDHYFVKPVKPTLLVALLERWKPGGQIT